MKYIFTFIFCLGFISINSSFGQEETKKVVIIKKTVDANGVETTHREEASGKEADALIKKMKEDGNLKGIDIEVEIEKAKKSGSSRTEKIEETEDGTVIKSIVRKKEVKGIKIESEEDGEKKVLIWDGTGEMPEEIAEKIKHLNLEKEGNKINKEESISITIDAEEHDDGGKKEKKSIRIETEENGEKKVLIWDGTGEMPEEIAEKMKHLNIETERKIINDEETISITIDAEDHDDDTEIEESYTIEKRIYIKEGSKNNVTLGIMIEDDSQGVVISDVVSDSVAKRAGLKKGDTIVKVNDQYVFNTKMLLRALGNFDKGDSAIITFLRNGKENTVRTAF